MSQQDVWDYLKKKPKRYYPMNEIYENVHLSKGCLTSNLRRMYKSKSVDRKLVPVLGNKKIGAKQYAYRRR